LPEKSCSITKPMRPVQVTVRHAMTAIIIRPDRIPDTGPVVTVICLLRAVPMHSPRSVRIAMTPVIMKVLKF